LQSGSAAAGSQRGEAGTVTAGIDRPDGGNGRHATTPPFVGTAVVGADDADAADDEDGDDDGEAPGRSCPARTAPPSPTATTAAVARATAVQGRRPVTCSVSIMT
jgi:hypothetical protein